MTPNHPHRLLRAEPVETVRMEGFPIEAAFLVFEDALGRRCRVYAERCLIGDAPGPALIHCPGGGQTVGREDLIDWARKGFSSVSFDWQIGNFPHHDPARKSVWPDGVANQIAYIRAPEEAILPVAVQAAGVCIDWIGTSPVVDGERIGVVGISWGGYLTWLIAAYEPRIKVAVPVYGCGGQFSTEHPNAFRFGPGVQEVWRRQWDPCSIAHLQSKPVCYLSSSNDFFGLLPFANDLLNRLQVPKRRGWLPNANHCIGAEQSALGLAWLKHHLADGPPLPEEPVLTADFTVQADCPDQVTLTEVWWTPELVDGDTGCWLCGQPPANAAAVYGRAFYRDGLALSTPVTFLQTGNQKDPEALPAEWPNLADGLGWNWGMGSTQFHTNRVRVESPGHPVAILHRDPGKTDDPLSFFHNAPAHPGWNTGTQEAVRFGLQAIDADPLTEVTVALLCRGSRTAQEVAHTLPVIDDTVTIQPADWPNFPSHHRWSSIVRIEFRMQTRAGSFKIGPLTRIARG
ncbi:MAG: alpha/beta hydrolase family protein [Oceanipulchritudo sp.]